MTTRPFDKHTTKLSSLNFYIQTVHFDHFDVLLFLIYLEKRKKCLKTGEVKKEGGLGEEEPIKYLLGFGGTDGKHTLRTNLCWA